MIKFVKAFASLIRLISRKNPLLVLTVGLAGLLASPPGLAKTVSTTVVAISPNPAFVSQAVTLTAKVTGSNPTGTITFKDGTTSLGTANLSSGSATLTKSFTKTGSHSITASYAGDTNNSTSKSAAASLKINAKTTSSVALTASPKPATIGQAVVMTASIAGATPTGTVTFKDGSTILGTGAVSAGKATYTATFTTSGTHSLTASYGGDTANSTSTSSSNSLTVNKVASTTTLTVSANPVLVSQTVVLTASVTGMNPSGTVTFKDGTTTLGTGAISSGKAIYNATFSASGGHTLTASYGGDTANNASGSTAVALTVNPKAATTTTVVTSTSPAVTGQSVVLTATVSIASATGSIAFKDGTTTLGSATLINGVANFPSTFSTTGQHSLTAVYSGDSGNASSTSLPFALMVNAKPSTTTTLSVTPNPTGLNQAVTMTANVVGSNPSGTVTFKDGATTLAAATLVSGVATYSKSYVAAGTRSLTAVYGGDSANAGSTSSAVSLTVNSMAASSTNISPNKTTAQVNEVITVNITVSGANPTGTVDLMVDNSYSAGTGTLSGGATGIGLSFGGAGTYTISARYNGDAKNSSSLSQALLITVNPALSSITSLLVSPNPSALNEAVTLVANVAGSGATHPTGTVTFKDDVTNYGSAAISGDVAALNVSFSTTGSRNIHAEYSGDSNYPASSSPVSQLSVVDSRSSIALSFAKNPVRSGDTVSISAAVTGSSPSGQVTFLNGASVVGTSVISEGVASMQTTFNVVGKHSITATYPGDQSNTSAVSSATDLIVGPQVTTTSLVVNAASQSVGQRVTLTASIVGLNPTGSVTFYDGATAVGVVAVANSSATLTTFFANVGDHQLSAAYSGDAVNPGSTSAHSTLHVSPVSTTTTLNSNVNPVAIGQALTLSASVSGFQPSGVVTFSDGPTVLGQAPISNGAASLSVSLSSAGVHTLNAAFGGDVSNSASASQTLRQVVQGSLVVISATPNPAALSQPVSFTVTVAGNNPSGTVSILDGDASLGSGSLVSGSASFSFSLSSGSHSISAVYSGDSGNPAGKSDPIAVNLLPDPASTTGAAPMTWNYWYDAEGNMKTQVDPLGNQTDHAYDTLNRNTSITQPYPSGSGSSRPAVSMAYNGQDATTSVSDPRSLTTSYSLDGLGNLWSVTSPDTGTKRATPDVSGKAANVTDARGKTAVYTYDQLDRLTRVDYPTGTPTVYEHDGGPVPVLSSMGRLTKISDESGSTSYSYDGFGRVLTKTQVIGASAKTLQTSYAWGKTGFETGKLTAITYPSGARAVYVYDVTGRVSGVSVNPVNASGIGADSSNLPLLSNATYTATGAVSGWSWADGVVYQRTFDSLGRIVSYPLGNPAGVGIAAGLTRSVTYDGAGQIKGFTHSNQSGEAPSYDQSFSYDGLGRVTGNTQSGTSYGYAYDSNGNLTNRTIGSGSYSLSVSSTSNRLNQVQSPSGISTVTSTYSYDAAGHLTSDGVATYAYSDRGRMSSATVSGGTVTYLYNALEQRVSKAGPIALVNTGAAYYAYDEAGQLLGEYDADLVPVYETIYIGSMPVAVVKQVRSGSGASLNIQTTLGNVYADHLDTPRVITRNSDAAIVWRWDGAEAFGNTAANDAPTALGVYAFNQRFPGQVYDKELGSFYNINRNYSPQTGRYLQSDPIGLVGGTNTYAYVGGNPLSFVDPTGEFAILAPLIPWAVGGGSAAGWGWGSAAVGAAAVAAIVSTPGDTAADKSRTVPYPDRKRGKYTCICRADKNGRSPDNCSKDGKDFAMGYGEGSSITEAKKAAEKDAKDKLGAKSVHHVQCRCRAPNGDPIIPTR